MPAAGSSSNSASRTNTRSTARRNASVNRAVSCTGHTTNVPTGVFGMPVAPGGTGKEARWIDIHENDLDEAQMTIWVKQAAALPGWVP